MTHYNLTAMAFDPIAAREALNNPDAVDRAFDWTKAPQLGALWQRYRDGDASARDISLARRALKDMLAQWETEQTARITHDVAVPLVVRGERRDYVGVIQQAVPPDSDAWIEWHGGPCPVAPETVVEVRGKGLSDSCTWSQAAGDLDWRHYPDVRLGRQRDITAYRIVQPATLPPEALTAAAQRDTDIAERLDGYAAEIARAQADTEKWAGVVRVGAERAAAGDRVAGMNLASAKKVAARKADDLRALIAAEKAGRMTIGLTESHSAASDPVLGDEASEAVARSFDAVSGRSVKWGGL